MMKKLKIIYKGECVSEVQGRNLKIPKKEDSVYIQGIGNLKIKSINPIVNVNRPIEEIEIYVERRVKNEIT